MPDLSGLGDLVLTVGGDISPLTSKLDEIPGAAQQAAAQIQAAFDALPSATDSVTQSMARLSEATQQAGQSASTGTQGWMEMKPALDSVSDSADKGGHSLLELSATFVGVELSVKALIEGIKELASAAIGTFSEIERSTIALTALTGNAQLATDRLNELKISALALAVPFDQMVEANQKVMALGFSARQAGEALNAAANAAAAVGLNFSLVSPAMDRIAQSGMLAARQLATIGLNLNDIAKAMNATVADLQGPGNIFKALDPGDRLDVLIAAMRKYQGVAQEVAASLSGQFQNLKTQIELALSGVGEALAPMLKSLMSVAQESLVPAIESLVQGFKDLAAAIGPLVGGILTQLVQGIGDMGTVIGSTISGVVNLASALHGSLASNAAEADINWKTLLADVMVVEPWHLAATQIELVRGTVAMFNQDALTMKQRFSDVTETLQKFIDKQAVSGNSLLGIREAFDGLKQALADAKDNLEKVTEAYNKHMASAGQVEAATKAVEKAQSDLNGTVSAGSWTIKGYADELAQLKTALQTAKDHLAIASEAYAEGSASLKQYETALAAVKSAQDALNGSIRQTPAQEVADAYQKLIDNVTHYQRVLVATEEALKNGGATVGMYQKAVHDLDTAEQALTGTSDTLTTKHKALTDAVSSSAPKIIEVANVIKSNLGSAYDSLAASANAVIVAHDAAIQHTKDFIGPIQEAGNAVEVYAGSHRNAAAAISQVASGIEVLKGSVPQHTANVKDAVTWVYNLKTGWEQMSDVAGRASQTIMDFNARVSQMHSAVELAAQSMHTLADAAASTIGPVQAAGEAAMKTAQSLGQMLDAAMNAPIGSLTIGLKPGDQYSMPFVGNPVKLGGVGGIGADLPNETQTYGTPQQIIAYAAQLWAEATKNVNTSAAAVTTAATDLSTATQPFQDAATLAYEAAKAQGKAADSITQAGDAISTSALAAADAANQAAFDNSRIAVQTVQAVTLATNTMAVAAGVITKLGVATGTLSATSVGAITTSVGGSSLSLPSFGPGGGMSGGLSPGSFTPYYQSTVGGSGPLVVNVSGSQFLSSLMNEFVRTLQTQGIRLTRG